MMLNKEFFDQLNKYVKEKESEKRYKHTLGVVKYAEKYAGRFGADIQKARIAAVFHDVCKDESDALSHGPDAAKLLRERFGVEDEDILNAIHYHTVGRANMSMLERVVKCADLTEPTRDYPNVDYFRKRLSYDKEINPVFYEMMLECREVLRERGEDFSESSEQCIEWLEDELGKRSKMKSKELAVYTAKKLDEKKAKDITIIDISEKSGFADYFVIATAGSTRQIDALKIETEDKLAEKGLLVHHIEGKSESGWILMDYGDLIINIFSPEQRERFQLEKVWGDCDRVDFEAAEN